MRRLFTFLGWPLLVVPQAIYWLGAFLNQVAMAANHGLMPVYWHACSVDPTVADDARHTCMTYATNLKFLCDWINLSTAVLSIGDVFIYAGELLISPMFWMWAAYAVYCMLLVDLSRDPA